MVGSYIETLLHVVYFCCFIIDKLTDIGQSGMTYIIWQQISMFGCNRINCGNKNFLMNVVNVKGMFTLSHFWLLRHSRKLFIFVQRFVSWYLLLRFFPIFSDVKVVNVSMIHCLRRKFRIQAIKRHVRHSKCKLDLIFFNLTTYLKKLITFFQEFVYI